MVNARYIGRGQVTLTDPFWTERLRINREQTVPAVFEQFEKTGRFGALDFTWTPKDAVKPHIFWDSDIAKWIESAAYTLAPGGDPATEKRIDDAVAKIAAHRRPDGYFNSYFQQVCPEAVFTRRTEHELYCAGHLIEAAVAYFEATGKDALLRIVEKYADLIDRVFRVEGSAAFATPGHEEIELALLRLWKTTGEEKWLRLARHFIDRRGRQEEDEYPFADHRYSQSHLPVRLQKTAEGHAVRAVYLYTAMAMLARADGDEGLAQACRELFTDISERKMYVTGAIGSSAVGEAFTIPYDLPDMTAYAESCATIGLMFFAAQMTLLEPDARYADVLERALYNGYLSSVSLDGRSFFYENPLAVRPQLEKRDVCAKEGGRTLPVMQRQRVFSCSCCPPNIARFMPQLAGYIYSLTDDTLFVHQYIAGEAADGGMKVRQLTDYPRGGHVRIEVSGCEAAFIAVRRPFWCASLTAEADGAAAAYTERRGYLYIPAKPEMTIDLTMDMPVTAVRADPRVIDCRGKAAVMRGPVVYCAEGADNGGSLGDLRLAEDMRAAVDADAPFGVPCLTVDAVSREPAGTLYSAAPARETPVRLRLIPYFAFANRGVTEMAVWLEA